MSEKIIELAKKVKTLAEQGTDGERSAAEGRLKILMDKYGLTPEDIESEQKRKIEISYSNRHKRLLRQVFFKVLGKDADIFFYKNSHKNLFVVYGTSAEEVEIRALFDHYSKAFDKESQTFFSAFIQRNNLLPKDRGHLDFSELSEEERNEIRRIIKMMDGIQESEYYKRLEGKKEVIEKFTNK
jgi:hypothetical protein